MATTAIAAPSISSRETSCPNKGDFTDKDWCSGVQADNVDVRISDKKTDYGTVNPGDLIGSVRDHCSNAVCEGMGWSLPSKWITNPDGDESDKGFEEGEIDVLITTAITDPKHLDGMLDSLQYSLDRLKDFKVDEKQGSTTCGASGCSGTPDLKYEHTKGPHQIVIEIREENEDADSIWDKAIVASLALEFTQKKYDDTDGLCSLILGAGAAIAGGVNGVLGSLGSLGLLGCQDS
ncbi:hypothetical protein F4808DRAFT_459382 [Astrocystis sublimbata]|nr:hypothetical protein F4808DRAFT_459382 [Astrocystis sublimbata]